MNSDDLNILCEPKGPWCLKVICTHSILTDGVLSFRQRHPEAVCIFLRGKRMMTAHDLFDEFAAALQFPYYFGYNGNAFDECLTDLSWLPAKMYILSIFDSSSFLANEPAQLPLFVDAFERICHQWGTPVKQGEAWDRPALPFHILFHSTVEDIAKWPSRIMAIAETIS